MAKFPLFGLFFGAMLVATQPADAALNAYLRMKGQKTGEFKGSVIQKGREGKVMVIAVDHLVTAEPGRRHGTFVITKEVDRSSPLLYRALASNELIPEWELQFWRPSTVGGANEVQVYTVRLTNARITSVHLKMANNKNPDLMRYAEYEEVGFTYEGIEWAWSESGATATASDKR